MPYGRSHELAGPKQEEGQTFGEYLHACLDRLISQVKPEQGEYGGGEVIANAAGRKFRITFCEFTGQHFCRFCNGTGIDRFGENKG